MGEVNSAHANIMFFGNLVDAGVKLQDLEIFLIDVNNFIEDTFEKLSSKKFRGASLIDFEITKEQYRYSFGEILRKSFVVTLCIFLEQEIGKYCEEFQKQIKLDIGWKDLRGSMLERFKNFIQKIIKLKLNFNNTIWQDLQAIISLRNCLVHSDSSLKNFSDAMRLRAFSKKYSIEIENDYVEISINNCEECLGIVQTFIEIIYDSALLYFPGKYGKKGIK